MKKHRLKEQTHTFNHMERKNVLSIFLLDEELTPRYVDLNTGKKVIIPANVDNKKKLAIINNNMRRHVYKRLVEMGKDANHFIVKVDGPTKITNTTKQSFIGCDMMWQNTFGNDWRDNEEFARELIEKFQDEIKILTLE